MSDAAPRGRNGRRPFVHLHTHTEYSLLDGMSRLSEVTRMAEQDGMPAVAITDHGNLFGALKFHAAAREVGVKPILGCEAYVAPGDRREQNPDSENQHLVLLAKNRIGFQNLMRLSSIAHSEGFYFKPRMDFALLEKHHEGLIALSACPKGIVPREVTTGGDPVEWAGRYQEVFGKGNYYLELMDHTPPGGAAPEGERLSELEQRIRDGVIEVSRRTGIPLVGTNDSHYASPEDAEAHDLRLCISVNRAASDPRRLKFHSDQFFFKTSEQMETVFEGCPDAYRNTVEIAEQVEDFDFVEKERSLLPHFEVPEGKTLAGTLEESVARGLAWRLESPEVHGKRPPRPDYEDRLRMELDVIQKTGYSAYFLIVEDFVRFSRERRIPVGPGRGSAAGSLVAYALGITDIDPLAHGLLFERFLNPDRVSPPDIDVDFCEFRREEVLEYVTERYGNDRVAQIMTLGSMKAKLVVRDVGRMLELPPPEVDRLAKLIPDLTSLSDAFDRVPALREARADPQFQRLFELAERLEGLPRNVGTHAAGVVISPEPLEDILPLYRDVAVKKSGSARTTGDPASAAVRRRTQWDMKDCEAIGLFKMDFLGLRNLTQIDDCARRIADDADVAPSPEEASALALIQDGHFEKVPPDPDTFALFSRAETDGIFQFESRGMRELLSSYKPENLDDLAALNALYRPGPLESGMAADFVAAKKKGGLSDKLDHRVRALFPETRGLIVYQEQVMLAAQNLAGYSLGQADILRKAMGKKDPEVMRSEEGRFVEGAVAGGLDRRVAEETFQQIAKFAGYGFNRSHAVGYAVVAYVAGWLKTHFPLHFLASLLTAGHRSGDKDERIARIRKSAQAVGIPVLPPDVRRSGAEALVEGKAVRYGLEAVKQVGTRAAREIERARRDCGDFESLAHFLESVEPKTLNRGAVEALCCAGALDFLRVPRWRILPAIPGALEAANRARGRQSAGVQSLFGAAHEAPVDVFPDAEAWTDAERLRREQDALGFFWEGHPATEYRAALKNVVTGPVKAVLATGDKAEVGVVGLVRELRKRATRAGRAMGRFTVEDETGSIPVVAFPEMWSTCPPLESEPVALVRGVFRRESARSGDKGRRSRQQAELHAHELLLADEAPYRLARRVELLVREPERLGSVLEELLAKYPGGRPLLLRVRARGIEVLLETATAVRPCRDLARDAWDLLGPDTLRLDGRLPPDFAR